MMVRTRKVSIVFLTALMAVGFPYGARAMDQGFIEEIKISPDLHRIVFRSSAAIDDVRTTTVDGPPRLVLDMPDQVPLAKGSSSMTEKSGPLKVRVSKASAGARAVVDFGGAPIPDYRVVKMDTCVIVFLGDIQVPSRTGAKRRPDNQGFQSVAGSSSLRSEPADEGDSLRERLGNGDLVIESADTVNGMIVLRVSDRKNPAKAYRIELGVDVNRLGFRSAAVTPIAGADDSRASDRRPAHLRNTQAANHPRRAGRTNSMVLTRTP
jgi:hypothetical protein